MIHILDVTFMLAHSGNVVFVRERDSITRTFADESCFGHKRNPAEAGLVG